MEFMQKRDILSPLHQTCPDLLAKWGSSWLDEILFAALNRFCLWVLFAAVAVGCGKRVQQPTYTDQLVPVTGIVKVNGLPAEGVEVTLVPEMGGGGNSQGVPARLATGSTDGSGKYSLATPPSGPASARELARFQGALPGKYAATFHLWVAPDGKPWTPSGDLTQGPVVSGAVEKLPPHLGNPASTPYQVEIKSGPNTLDFELKTK